MSEHREKTMKEHDVDAVTPEMIELDEVAVTFALKQQVAADGDEFTPAQLQRVAALDAARRIVSTQHPFGSNGPDVVDVVAVAQWILTGEDPWSTVNTEER